MKRILVISDLHCGHETGLTHPDFQYAYRNSLSSDLAKRKRKFAEIQRQVWDWYTSTIESLKPIDILFDMGDNIEGPAEKSSGTELITSDLNEQCTMAEMAIDSVKADKIFMVYGTYYHVSRYQDCEDTIADMVGADKIGSREFIDVNGVVFDLKHQIGRSSIPHGQGTLLAKEKLWNTLWAHDDLQPYAHIVLRGHIHFYSYVGRDDWLAMSLPALQWSSKYGARVAQGKVGLGMVKFDVEDSGDYSFEHLQCNLGVMKAKLIKA